MGELQKGPHTSFSRGTSANVWVIPQNFLAFSFHAFATLLWNFKAIPSASLKLLNLNHKHRSKIGFSGQIFVIIFLAEMLELLKIGHITTSTK